MRFMPQHKTIRWILIFWLWSGFNALAQTTAPLPLSEYLKQLEFEYDIKFSYRPEDVDDQIVSIAITDDLEGLGAKLDFIQSRTGLWAEQIDRRYISLNRTKTPRTKYCGQILAGASDLPLSWASVQVLGTPYGTITDQNGTFFIENTRLKGDLRITYIGQKPLIVSADSIKNNYCPIFYSQSDPTTLETVSIGRFLTVGIIQRGQGNYSINTEAFGLLPGQTQNDALWFAQALPGVQSANETVSTMNIRGGANDENNISWEGIRMYQYGHFFGLISAFNPFLSTKVEVFKANAPGEFRNFVSGSMNISSSDQIPETTRFRYSVNLLDTQFATEIKANKRLGIKLAGRTSYNRWLPTPVYDSYFGRMFQDTEITNNQSNSAYEPIDFNEQFYFLDFGGKINYQLSQSTSVKLAFMAIENHFEFTEALGSIEKINKLEQKSQVIGLFVDHQWSDRHKTTAKISVNQYRIDALNQEFFSNQTLKQDNKVLDLDTYITHELNLEGHKFKATYNFNEIGIGNRQEVNTPLFFSSKKEVLRSHMMYLNWKFAPAKKPFNFSIAGRLSHYPKWNQTLAEPLLLGRYKLSKKQSLSISYEQRHQAIGQRVDLQSDFLGIEKRRWALADGQTKPLRKGDQWSLSWQYQIMDFGVNAAVYHKNVTALSAESQLFQNQFQFQQALGGYQTSGLELSGQKTFGLFDLWMSYTWGQNNYNFESFFPSEFPNNVDISNQFKWALNTTINQIKLSLGGHWHSGLPYTETTGILNINELGAFVPDYQNPNELRLMPYFRMDFAAEYRWWSKANTEFKVNLGLLNLADQKNILSRRFKGGLDSSGSPEISTINTYGLGFTPNIAFMIAW